MTTVAAATIQPNHWMGFQRKITISTTVAKPKTILGITIDTEKEIVLSVVEKDVAIKIMEQVKEKAGVGTAAHGLCFFLPVEMSTLALGEN
jgi:hypothetical protein